MRLFGILMRNSAGVRMSISKESGAVDDMNTAFKKSIECC